MSRIVYLDCFCGISGDMLLGAILDCGLVSLESLEQEIRRVVPSGWKLEAEKVSKGGLSATSVTVHMAEPQPERRLGDILALIGKSTLSPESKEKCARVFRLLAQAEGAVHGEDPESVHFHEVGALDAIVDVVGAVSGFHMLGAGDVAVHCSALPLGSGVVQTASGPLPVPAPAVVELLKGVPTVAGPAAAELTTPTGAAIARVVCARFGPMPDMKIAAVGYGAGKRDLPVPNVLRLMVGEQENALADERLTLIETNIDDMSPQLYEHVMNALFDKGALDVFLTPVIMKKSRPGTLVSVLAEPGKEPALVDVLFRETTTMGVRFLEVRRTKAEREIIQVQTQWGEIHVKVGVFAGTRKVSPEYEDCRAAAEKAGVPLMEVQQAARLAAWNLLKEKGV